MKVRNVRRRQARQAIIRYDKRARPDYRMSLAPSLIPRVMRPYESPRNWKARTLRNRLAAKRRRQLEGR